MKARLPKGIGNGNAQNVNTMLKQAQKMQDKISQLQDEIEARDFSATVGGGAIEIVMTGKKLVKSLKIQPDVVDPSDIETLQDLVISAFNEVANQIEATTEEEMTKITGGVSLPGII